MWVYYLCSAADAVSSATSNNVACAIIPNIQRHMDSGNSVVVHIRKEFDSQIHIYVTANVHTHRLTRLASLAIAHQNAQFTKTRDV